MQKVLHAKNAKNAKKSCENVKTQNPGFASALGVGSVLFQPARDVLLDCPRLPFLPAFLVDQIHELFPEHAFYVGSPLQKPIDSLVDFDLGVRTTAAFGLCGRPSLPAFGSCGCNGSFWPKLEDHLLSDQQRTRSFPPSIKNSAPPNVHLLPEVTV